MIAEGRCLLCCGVIRSAGKYPYFVLAEEGLGDRLTVRVDDHEHLRKPADGPGRREAVIDGTAGSVASDWRYMF
jgi:hypothetical protein